MKNIILIVLVFAGIFSSCDEREIPLFEDSNELYFDLPYVLTPRDDADTVLVSFFFYPSSVMELDVALCVKLSGDLLLEPTNYQLKTVDEYSSLPQENYKYAETYSYPKGKTTDTITVKLFKTNRLETKVDTLVVTFQENAMFRLGQSQYAKRIILVTAKALRPNWWDDKFSFAYLGAYSDKKLRLFVDLISDEFDDVLHFNELDPALQRKAALRFRYWLDEQKAKGKTVYEEDGKEMTVEVIG